MKYTKYMDSLTTNLFFKLFFWKYYKDIVWYYRLTCLKIDVKIYDRHNDIMLILRDVDLYWPASCTG